MPDLNLEANHELLGFDGDFDYVCSWIRETVQITPAFRNEIPPMGVLWFGLELIWSLWFTTF